MSRVLAAAAALALAAAGCGSPGPEEAVGAAEEWLDAVAEDRPADACELMLPSASRSLSQKFLDGRDGDCQALVRGYGERLSADKLEALRGNMEFSNDIQDGRLGVFPADRRYQFEVLLMELDGDAWKVTSVGIAPG